MQAAVRIAEADGVSVLEVFERGAFDMGLRVALANMKSEVTA